MIFWLKLEGKLVLWSYDQSNRLCFFKLAIIRILECLNLFYAFQMNTDIVGISTQMCFISCANGFAVDWVWKGPKFLNWGRNLMAILLIVINAVSEDQLCPYFLIDFL